MRGIYGYITSPTILRIHKSKQVEESIGKLTRDAVCDSEIFLKNRLIVNILFPKNYLGISFIDLIYLFK